MTTRKRGLGKGLDALLGSAASSASAPAGETDAGKPDEDGSLRVLPVDLIQRGKYQPRRTGPERTLRPLSGGLAG